MKNEYASYTPLVLLKDPMRQRVTENLRRAKTNEQTTLELWYFEKF